MMNDDQHFGDRLETDLDPVEDLALVDEKDIWVKRARNAYNASTDYMSSSVRNQWETNLNNFHSEHPAEVGRDPLAGKKMFRPKIRSSLRGHEAALASALFTNSDLVSVKGVDENSTLQSKSAKLNKVLVQHRLDKTIPWFLTAMGAYQDTNVYGVCISKNYWKYETRDVTEFNPALDEEGEEILDEEGYVLGEEVVINTVIEADEPVIDLLAPENFRFDPNADWRDPAGTSPYLIEQMPMYATDVLNSMGHKNEKTNAPEWFEYSLDQIIAAGTGNLDGDATRLAREKDRTDPVDIGVINEFKTVWVHFNIYNHEGVDMAYYTIGTTLLLSEPVPLTDYHKHGRDVYTIGVSTVEAHRNYPSSVSELGEQLQREINILADQRYENVRLVLNKRYMIKRQGNVDLGALMRNVPGGGIMVDNPKEDVEIINTPDVTSSSYAEQDRLNMDMDELMGTFSSSTVQSNRAMNETVGGMNLMSNGANIVQEYAMRTFIETWVEKVLGSLTKLIQYYETDATILALAAGKAGLKEELIQMAGSPEKFDELIQQELTVTVNVGMGNTNPQQKLQRLMMAVQSTAQMPQAQEITEWEEVIKEIYSYAGYGDGARFLKQEDPNAPKKEDLPPPEVQAVQAEAQAEQQKTQAEYDHEQQMLSMKLQSDAEREIRESTAKRELELIKMADAKGIKVEELRSKIAIESSKDKTNRDIEAARQNTLNREMNIKVRMGSGI